MADISKITLPSGNSYDLKDAYARSMLGKQALFTVAWDGASAPAVAKIPEGVVVSYNSTNYTGTLKAANAQSNLIYLVGSGSTGGTNNFTEYIIADGKWERLGSVSNVELSELGTLAGKDNVTLNKGAGVSVLTSAATIVLKELDLQVTGTPEKALGPDTTITVTQPTVTVTPTKSKIKATASGVAVGANGTASVVKAISATESMLQGVSNVSKGTLYSNKVRVVGGTETVSKVTKTASKLVTTTVPNVTSAGAASTWKFEVGTGADAETLIISGGNGTAPTLGTAKTVATGSTSTSGAGSSIVSDVAISDKIVAVAGSEEEVLVGLSYAGDAEFTENGAEPAGEVVTTVLTSETPVLSGIGSEIATVLTGVKVTSQPTVSLATTTETTGAVEVVTGISSAKATGAAATLNNDDLFDVVYDPQVEMISSTIEAGRAGASGTATVPKLADLSVTVS